MRNIAKYTGIALIIILIIVSIYLSKPIFEEKRIRAEIEKANYCEVKSDCIQVESQCPFDCYVFVNKNEAERVGGLIMNYSSSCAYICVEIRDYDCVRGKCIHILADIP